MLPIYHFLTQNFRAIFIQPNPLASKLDTSTEFQSKMKQNDNNLVLCMRDSEREYNQMLDSGVDTDS